VAGCDSYLSFRRFENSRNVEVSAKNEHEHGLSNHRITNTSTSHDHGSSAFIIQLSSLPSQTPLSDPGHTDTGLWIRPSRTILSSRIIFFSKLSTIRQQSPPESAYANSLKGMRIHRDGSLAHAEGWEQSQIPKKLLVRNRPYR